MEEALLIFGYCLKVIGYKETKRLYGYIFNDSFECYKHFLVARILLNTIEKRPQNLCFSFDHNYVNLEPRSLFGCVTRYILP